MDGTESEIVDALEAIVVAGVAMTNAALARAGGGHELTFPQWRVLVVLSDPAGLPVAEVARLISVTLPATGRQLRRLEQRGLVTLEPDLSDRRVTRVRLTQAGMDVRGSIIADRKAAIRRAVRDVGGPEVVDGLQRLAVALGSATAPPAKISRRVKVAAR